jgi:hypothetical protein
VPARHRVTMWSAFTRSTDSWTAGRRTFMIGRIRTISNGKVRDGQ